MTEELIQLERRTRDGAAVAVVTLQRPHVRNALSMASLRRFGEIGRELLADTTLRCAILTGAGEEAFCAGADLKERARMSDDEVRAMLTAYRTELAWLSDPGLPTIAALNGVALGGGLELALACDLRIAHPRAIVGFPETRLGVIPGAGGTQRLPRLIGEARAKELILFGRRLPVREAEKIGLVHHVTDDVPDLVQATLGWADGLIKAAPVATRAALSAIIAGGELPLTEGLEREAAEYERCLVSDDCREALDAFREKRQPVFRGR